MSADRGHPTVSITWQAATHPDPTGDTHDGQPTRQLVRPPWCPGATLPPRVTVT